MTKLAFVLVVYKDKFLLGFNHQKQRYEYFGGHVEQGESFYDGAVRELYEESAGTICAKHLTILKRSPNIKIYLYRLKQQPDFELFHKNKSIYLERGLKHFAEMDDIVLLSIDDIVKHYKNKINSYTLDAISNYIL